MSTLRAPRPRFSRRTLLRSLGASTALFSPFARPRAATAQSAPPGNLLIFYTPNGHKRRLVDGTLCFDAAAAPGGLTLGTSLQPLSPFQRDVAVIKGLNLKTPTFIASHQDICRILTCCSAPKEGNDQTQFTAFGPSIDQTVAASFNQQPLVVAVDPFRDIPMWRTFLSWSASGVSAPFVKNHQEVFTELFGGLTGPRGMANTMATLADVRAGAASLPDAVRSGMATFGTRVSGSDHLALESYLQGLRFIEQRGVQLLPPTCAPTDLQARITALPAATVQNDDRSPDGHASELQTRGELWMDMIAMAFACGTRRVAVIQWQGAAEGYNPPDNLGSPSHREITLGAAPVDHWVAIDTWYASRFAYQLAALKQLGILDRTIVVWISETTEGDNQLNMVVVVAGGQTLGLKTGQYIEYPFTGQELEISASIPIAQNPANRSLADLWVTIQQALGVNKATFGDPKWSTGPLVELRA
jgi:hypothetical protein